MFIFRFFTRLLTFFTDRSPSIEQRALLQILNISTTHGLPPSELVAAFADDAQQVPAPQLPSLIRNLAFLFPRIINFGWSRRLHKLARRLASGSSLGDSVELTPGLLPISALHAIRFGSEMGTLHESLKIAGTECDSPTEEAIQRITDALSYLIMLLLVGGLIATFSLVKIMPTLFQILLDFEIEVPPITQNLASIGRHLPSLWLIMMFVVLVVVWYTGSGMMSRALHTAGWQRCLAFVSRTLRRRFWSSWRSPAMQVAP